jgi:quinol monooxygenase YgiN
MSEKIAIFAKVKVQPGKRDDAVQAFKVVTDAVVDEPGTEAYVLHLDAKDEDVIWFYELYTDRAGFDAHGKSAAMAELIGTLGPLLAGAPELTRATPVSAKGVDI